MNEEGSTNVFWHAGDVTREDRGKLIGQQGVTLWFTGLSGSGKSTIAMALEKALLARGKLCYRLDGDNVRLGINKNLGFSAVDRSENNRRIGEICKLFIDASVIVLSSFISPYMADRQAVRELHDAAGFGFVEVYVDCSLSVAEQRDPKGLYRRARRGEISNFTGIDDPYEIPINPDIHLRSDHLSLDDEVRAIIQYLEQHKFIAV
jgi:adenylylsulfate kinase